MKRESAERRKAHPGWPSHKPTLHKPDGRTIVFETMPIGKADGLRAYCKYCYTTHENWWRMDPREVAGDDTPIILCGNCEHTSLFPRVNSVTAGTAPPRRSWPNAHRPEYSCGG